MALLPVVHLVDLAELVGALYFLWVYSPPHFYPEPSPDGVNCGMPVLGVNMAFWFIGGFFVFITHLVSSLFFIFRKKKTTTEHNAS